MRKYIQDRNHAILAAMTVAKARLFCRKSFVPVTWAGVFIWKNFHHGYQDLGRKNRDLGNRARGPFLEGPEKFSHPKSRSKISNLLTSELFYAHILNINRGSLHTRSFRRIHLSVFKYQWTKNGFTGPKSFRGFRETGPSPASHMNTSKFLRRKEWWGEISETELLARLAGLIWRGP